MAHLTFSRRHDILIKYRNILDDVAYAKIWMQDDEDILLKILKIELRKIKINRLNVK